MSEVTLSSINIFPVKSLGSISLSQSFVSDSGLAFDRRFMLSDPQGQLLSARQVPALLQFKILLRDEGIEIIAPDGDHLSVRYPELFQNYRQVTIWGTEINAQHCGIGFDEWFSNKLGRECHLLYFGEQSERYTSRRLDKPVAFADGYPLLVISEASLEDLNSRATAPVTMEHFRTNLVAKGCEPFAEDSWKRIRIGEVEFEVIKPCSRCVMTTYDPATGKKIANGEPIKTLSQYRMGASNDVFFGQNLIPLNEGRISVDDHITVLETQIAEVYPDNTTRAVPKDKHSSRAKRSIQINLNGTRFTGNNQHSVLEQAEANGLMLPSACRAGLCGVCKVKLLSGEVQRDSERPLTHEERSTGIILACSCTPLSDVHIEL